MLDSKEEKGESDGSAKSKICPFYLINRKPYFNQQRSFYVDKGQELWRDNQLVKDSVASIGGSVGDFEIVTAKGESFRHGTSCFARESWMSNQNSSISAIFPMANQGHVEKVYTYQRQKLRLLAIKNRRSGSRRC